MVGLKFNLICKTLVGFLCCFFLILMQIFLCLITKMCWIIFVYLTIQLTHFINGYIINWNIFYSKQKRWPTDEGRKKMFCLMTNSTGRKEMFYLTTHSTHFIYGYMASDMVKDHSDNKRGNPLLPHGLLFLIVDQLHLRAWVYHSVKLPSMARTGYLSKPWLILIIISWLPY